MENYGMILIKKVCEIWRNKKELTKIIIACFICVNVDLGLKTKTKIFDYREPFSRFYRDSGVNENENSYRKYRNKNGIFIRN